MRTSLPQALSNFPFFAFVFGLSGSFPSECFRFNDNRSNNFRQRIRSSRAISHLLSSPAHHFNPMRTVTRPDGPPFRNDCILSFPFATSKLRGSPSETGFFLHRGCIVFHQESHSIANTSLSGITGQDPYLRDDNHFVNNPGRVLAGIRNCLIGEHIHVTTIIIRVLSLCPVHSILSFQIRTRSAHTPSIFHCRCPASSNH